MKAPPQPWRVRHGRDPESELRRLNRRFRAVSRGLDRAAALRRVDRWARVAALIVIGAAALFWALVMSSPWPPGTALRHIASFPTCNAARAVGLAPAKQGEPGYWRRHDADEDSTSCEPWPRSNMPSDRLR